MRIPMRSCAKCPKQVSAFGSDPLCAKCRGRAEAHKAMEEAFRHFDALARAALSKAADNDSR